MRSIEIKKSVAEKLLAQRQQIIESHASQAALACYVSPHGHSAVNREHTSALQPWVEKEFLQSDTQVLLLKGAGGSGKSTFNQQLLCTLWQDKAWDEFKPGDLPPRALAPIWIPLGSHTVDSERLFNYLSQLPEPFTEEEINILKSDYRLLLIADGYDEVPGARQINLYDANQLGRYEGRVKLLISARIEEHAREESTYFVPHRADGRLAWSLYKERYVAAFNPSQRVDYITQYLAKNKREKDSKLWTDVATYERHFADIPGIEPLLATPFVLMMAVETLPSIMAEVKSVVLEDSKESKKKLEETSQPLTSELRDRELLPMITKSAGDCAFHAILGVWDLEQKMLVCPDPKEKRQQIGKAIYEIADSKKNNRLRELSMAGIKELIMSGRAIAATTQILLQHYQQFLKDQDALQPALWDAFAKKLNEYPTILEYIDKHGHPKGQQTPRAKFYDALNKKEGELYGRLLSLPALNQAFRDYNLLRDVQFDWDAYLKEDSIKEYADFVSQPEQWLLPHELEIIAIVFNIKIVFYAYKNAIPQIFNEGQYPTVHVQFNGLDHYEQLQSVPKRIHMTLSLEQLYLTRSKLYDQFMAAWFSRQAEKAIAADQSLKDPEKILGSEVVAELTAQTSAEPLVIRLLKRGYAEFCQHLAQHLQMQGRSTLRYPAEEKHESRLTKKIKEKESPKEQTMQPDYVLSLAKLFSKTADRTLIRQGCPLRQERSNEYSFLHTSFIDYFVTTLIYQQAIQQAEEKAIISKPVLVTSVEKSDDEKEKKIEVTKDVVIETPVSVHKKGRAGRHARPSNPITQRLMARESIQFLADRVDQDEKFSGSLWDWIERSKHDEATQTILAAANAITILNAANKSFSDKDFNGIRIPGADLTGGIFHGTQLQNADLTGVNFTDTHLEEVDFSGSLMKDIILNERPVLKGHSMPIRCMAYDREHDIAATGSGAKGKDCGIRIWDIKQSQLIDILVGHTDEVMQVLFRPNQKELRLVSLSKDNTICEWDVKNGKELRRWSSPTSLTGLGSISSDGELLALTRESEPSLESSVREQTSQEQKASKLPLPDPRQLLSQLMAIQSSVGPGGKINPQIMLQNPQQMQQLLAMLGKQLTTPPPLKKPVLALATLVSILDFTQNTWVHSFAPHEEKLANLQWSPGLETLLLSTSGLDNQLMLWDLTELKRPQRCWQQSAPSSAVLTFLPDGSGILTAESKEIVVRDSKTGKRGRLYQSTGLKDKIYSIASDENGQYISAGDGENIEIWEAQTGHSVAVLYGHNAPVQALAFSSKTIHLLISASHDRTLRQWQMERFLRPTINSFHHNREITSFLLMADEKTLISGSLDGTVRFWRSTTGLMLKVIPASTAGVTAMTLTPLEDELIVGDTAGDIHRLSLKNFRKLATFPRQHQGTVTCLSVYDHHQYHFIIGSEYLLASGGMDCTIRLWDWKQNKLIGNCDTSDEEGQIQTLWFSTEHSSGSKDGIHNLYGCVTATGGKEWVLKSKERKLEGNIAWMLAEPVKTECITGLPGGRTVVAAHKESFDIQIWNIDPQQMLCAMKGHRTPITIVNVSREGQIISGDKNGVLLVWSREYALQACLTVSSSVKQALLGLSRWIYASAIQQNSLLAYQISILNPSQVRLTWRQGARLDIRHVKANHVQQLSFANRELLQLSENFSKLEINLEEIQPKISQNQRYALDKQGHTALIRAVDTQEDKLVMALLKNGVSINQAGFDDWTPLQVAALQGWVTGIELLLDYKADIHQAQNGGFSPLYIAAQKGQVAAVKALLNHKADINQFQQKTSPLGIAAHEGHEAVVRTLLEYKNKENCTLKEKIPSLVIAASRGHVLIIKTLLEDKAEINQTNQDGESPLWSAVADKHEDAVAVLLACKADVNQANKDGTLPLGVALSNGKIITTLLDHKADVNKADKTGGKSPLVLASMMNNNESVVKILLKYKAAQGPESLFFACVTGHNEIIKILLEHKVDINQPVKSGDTPLRAAAREGRYAIVKFLLEHKANVNQFQSDGMLALSDAAVKGHAQIVRTLLEHKSNLVGDDLVLASIGGDETVVKILLEYKAEVNYIKKSTRMTPLLIASLKGQESVLKILLTAKASVNQVRDDNGMSPLFMACQQQSRGAVAKVLLEHKAEVNQSTKDGLTPLTSASFRGYTEVVETLLEYKADINQTQYGDISPLYFASQKGHEAIVKILLNYKANVNQLKKEDGTFPLHIASKNGYASIVKTLLEYKADVDQMDKNNGSSLHMVSFEGHESVVKVLLEHKADVNRPCQDGASSLCIASAQGHISSVKILVEHKAEVNQVTENGWSSLHAAVRRKQVVVVQYLLSQHINSHLQLTHQYDEFSIGMTALAVARMLGYTELIALLEEYEKNETKVSDHSVSSMAFFSEQRRQQEAKKKEQQSTKDRPLRMVHEQAQPREQQPASVSTTYGSASMTTPLLWSSTVSSTQSVTSGGGINSEPVNTSSSGSCSPYCNNCSIS